MHLSASLLLNPCLLSILSSEGLSEKAGNIWFSCLKSFTGTHRIKFNSLRTQASAFTPDNYSLVTHSHPLHVVFQFSLPECLLLLVKEETRIIFQDSREIIAFYLTWASLSASLFHFVRLCVIKLITLRFTCLHVCCLHSEGLTVRKCAFKSLYPQDLGQGLECRKCLTTVG